MRVGRESECTSHTIQLCLGSRVFKLVNGTESHLDPEEPAKGIKIAGHCLGAPEIYRRKNLQIFSMRQLKLGSE